LRKKGSDIVDLVYSKSEVGEIVLVFSARSETHSGNSRLTRR